MSSWTPTSLHEEVPDSHSSPDVEIHFLNVGQGDATLVLDNIQRRAMVIDCHRNGEPLVEQIVKDAQARLESAFITHFHTDHFEAIPNIVQRRSETAIFCNHAVVRMSRREQRIQARAFKRWLADEKSTGRGRYEVRDGQTGKIGQVSWQCLAPDAALIDSAEADGAENRMSIVLLLSLPGLSILVGADADAVVWQHVLERHVENVDILRVPHHGGLVHPAGFATSADILNAYKPKYTIVSVGTGNRYGHPHREWLTGARVISRVMCTQVTSVCHRSGLGAPTPCADHIVVQWWNNGVWRVLPDVESHSSVVERWSDPACLEPEVP
jgi:competence protein ComEC